MSRGTLTVALTAALATAALSGCSPSSSSTSASAPAAAPASAGVTATGSPSPSPSPPSSSPSVAWPAELPEADAMVATAPTWAVWLGTGKFDTDDRDYSSIRARLAEHGYTAAPLMLGCHSSSQNLPGAATSGDDWGIAEYFTDEASARLFASLWGSPVLGIGSGYWGCDFG